MVHLTHKDYWAELAIRHKDDIVQFLNSGAFSNNSVFSEYYKYYNENKPRDEYFFWKFKLDKNKHSDWAFTGVEVNNAINELRKIALDKDSPLDVQTPIVHLCKAAVSPVIARDVLMKTENNFRKILVTYFGLYPDLPEKKTPVFYELEERLNWLLIPFPDVQYPPIRIIRYTRNKVHSERVNPKTGEAEKDPQTGKILFNDQTLPDNPVLALQVVKFIVFSYVGTVAICRKFISKMSKAHTGIESFITKDVISKYWESRGKKAIPEDDLSSFEHEFRQWMDSILKSADKVLSQYDSTKKVTLKPHSHSEVLSVKWKVGESKWNDSPEMLVNPYEKIKAEVKVAEFDHKFTFESLITAEHTGNITLVLDCELNEARVECDMVDDEMLELNQDLDMVSLKVLTDLDCDLEVRGVTQGKVARRWETTELQVPKGIRTITLTAKNNPSYVMTRDVEMTEDIVINDMLFAKEVYKHREWWDIKNIIVLKYTTPKFGKRYVLWDKTVDIPVRMMFSYSDLDNSETGFVGEFFYHKVKDGSYHYQHLTDEDCSFFSERMIAFANGYEFCELGGKDACVIDENGTRLFTIFQSRKWEWRYGTKLPARSVDWPEELKKNYKGFIKKLQFSEDGYAAMLGPDGITIRFVSDKWKEVTDSYSYNGDYPVFRNGYCAVKKGDEGYLFLTSRRGYIKELSERYDDLMPVKVAGKWVYIAVKDSKCGVIDPTLADKFVVPMQWDFIGERCGHLLLMNNGKWEDIYGADIHQSLPLPYEEVIILSEHFFVISCKTGDVVVKHLCTNGRVIASDIKDYKLLLVDLVAVKCYDEKWCVFDSKGECQLSGICEICYDRLASLFLRVKRDERWEIYKVENSSLIKITEHKEMPHPGPGCYKFKDFHTADSVLTGWMNFDGEKLVKYNGQWVWDLDHSKIALNPAIIKSAHPLLPFSTFLSDGLLGLMRRDTMDVVVAPSYQSIQRIGDLWVADNSGMKTFISDSGNLLAENMEYDSISQYSSNLYCAEIDGDVCLVNEHGVQKSDFYTEIRPIINGFAAVKGNRWGFVKIEGEDLKVICEQDYYAVKDFTEEGYAMVQEDREGSWGLIDNEGNTILPCHYGQIDSFKYDYTSARIGPNWYIVNRKNEAVTFVYDKYGFWLQKIIIP